MTKQWRKKDTPGKADARAGKSKVDRAIDNEINMAADIDYAEKFDIPVHRVAAHRTRAIELEAASKAGYPGQNVATSSSNIPKVDLVAEDARYTQLFHEMMTEATNLHNTFLETKHDYEVDDCRNQMSHLRKIVGQHVAACVKLQLEECTELFRSLLDICAGYLHLMDSSAKVLGGVLDSWEDDFTVEDAIQIPPADVQKKLLEGITVTFPFMMDKPAFVSKASHPILHSSRVVGSTMCFMEAAKDCRRWLAASVGNSHKMAAVVDLGAGTFGGDRLQVLKTTAKNKNVYIHACIPTVDVADLDRVDLFRTDRRYPSYCYVPEQLVPRLGVLNYCRHKAHECTCLAKYDHIAPVAIHSSYYFKKADYMNVLQHRSCGKFTCIVHIPAIGKTIPVQTPEYEWVDVAQENPRLSWWQKKKAQVVELLSGVKQVAMLPLQTGETTYYHPDISTMLRRGGFHYGPLTNVADELTDPTTLARALGAIGFSAFANAAWSTPGPMPLKVAAGAVAAASVAAGVCTLVAVENRRSLSNEHPFGTKHTIAMKIKQAYVDAAHQEELLSVITVRKDRPHQLGGQCIESAIVDQHALQHATQAILLAGNTEKARAGVCAALVRDGKPLAVIKHSVEHAIKSVRFLCRPIDPPPPPSYAKCLVAIATLPFASGLARAGQSTLVAACSHHMHKYAATVIMSVVSTPMFWIFGTIFLWTNLMYVCTLLGVVALVRLLLE